MPPTLFKKILACSSIFVGAFHGTTMHELPTQNCELNETVWGGAKMPLDSFSPSKSVFFHQNHSVPDKLTSKYIFISIQLFILEMSEHTHLWRNIPPSVLPPERRTSVLPSIRHPPKKKKKKVAQTTLHSCLKSAGQPALPKALSSGAHKPASRAAHCRSCRAEGCSQLQCKQMPASPSRAEPRMEGTSGVHLVQPPGQRWVKHVNSWATGLKFKQDTF